MFCGEIPPSGVEECLKEHLGSIKSQGCRVVSHVEFFRRVQVVLRCEVLQLSNETKLKTC